MSHRLRFALALAWTLAVVVGCSLPGRALPELVLFSQDKLLHLAAFAGFGFLWHRVYPDAPGRILLWGFLFGGAIEVYQHVMPIGRFFDPLDWLADTAGLVLALGVLRLRRRAGASAVTPP